MTDLPISLASEKELISAALQLGALDVGHGISEAEKKLAASSAKHRVSAKKVALLRDSILSGNDPLGEGFSSIRSAETRRSNGATYTPESIVRSMMRWAANNSSPARVVDPGVGSGRFLSAAGRAFPNAQLVGIDVDPVATLMARANLSVNGYAERAHIILGDFRNFTEKTAGQTLYIGNPPYVRHHQIDAVWKDWLAQRAAELKLPASKLAGLHVYFFLATALEAEKKDVGAFVTASEWLDVNYGSLVRSLILGELGGKNITVIEPTAQPFPDAATTAAITTFEIGAEPKTVSFQRIDDLASLDKLGSGRRIRRDRLATEKRWSHLTRTTVRPPEGYVELGELCRVHRGTVTGANGVWIAGEHSAGLPDSVLFPTITRAREVFNSGGLLNDPGLLRQAIDLPADLDELSVSDRKRVESFLKVAKSMGAHSGYVARNRKAWWSIGLRAAAPIISTYMARRPPGFAVNEAGARHINIAHGLYPRDPMNENLKHALVAYLQNNISQKSGRTYAGGLTKFEPREMERVIVPSPEILSSGVCT
jgi:adenine-specific DNA-methyltransferase